MSAFLFDKQVRAKGEALYATRRIYVDSSDRIAFTPGYRAGICTACASASAIRA